MIGEINQNNLYLLLPSKVGRMATLVLEELNISLIEAIRLIYLSDTYRQLEKEDTKMWHLGPIDLYNDMTSGC